MRTLPVRRPLATIGLGRGSRRRSAVIGRFGWFAIAILAVVSLITLLGDVLVPRDPHAIGDTEPFQAPGPGHWMGTDDLGRDVLDRVVAGIRVSMTVGVGAALLATAIGVAVGALAGYARGSLDELLMRVTEAVQVIPRFFLAVVLAAFWGANVRVLIIAIAVLSWPVIARVARAELLTLRERQFVDAAVLAGSSPAQVVRRELLPNAAGPIIVTATVLVGESILLRPASPTWAWVTPIRSASA